MNDLSRVSEGVPCLVFFPVIFSGDFSFPVFILGCGFRAFQFYAMMIHKGFGLEFLIWFHPG